MVVIISFLKFYFLAATLLITVKQNNYVRYGEHFNLSALVEKRVHGNLKTQLSRSSVCSNDDLLVLSYESNISKRVN